VIDLNQFVSSDMGDLGALKTTQKFYRINGGSTQLEGVSSDIIMPDRYAYLKMGKEMLIMLCLGTKLTLPPLWDKTANFNKPFQIVKRECS
jgi:carboxyl-terminal processing protease